MDDAWASELAVPFIGSRQRGLVVSTSGGCARCVGCGVRWDPIPGVRVLGSGERTARMQRTDGGLWREDRGKAPEIATALDLAPPSHFLSCFSGCNL
jgi:hypothetical protein